MTCVELLRSQAFVDGELDSAASKDAERHLQDCAECQDFVAAAALAGDLIRRNAVRHAAPALLRRKVMADLAAAQKPALAPRGFWLGAGSGAGLMAMAASLAFFLLLPPAAATLGTALVNNHTSALMRGTEIAVASSDHHTVKPWFAGKLAISPPVADFAAQGFALAGGRKEHVAGQDMAVLVYRHGAHIVDVYVWADRGGALPSAALDHGYRVMAWKKADLDFAIVSDMENAEFENLSRLIRAEPE